MTEVTAGVPLRAASSSADVAPPGAALLALPRESGWRRVVVTRAQELLAALDDPPSERVVEAAAVLRAETQPHRIVAASRSAGPLAVARRVMDRLGAGEARRSEDATGALLALRREVLLSAPPTVVAAHVPELREEVKRLVDPAEACYDIYLRLLDRIETGHPHIAAAAAGSKPVPGAAAPGTTAPATIDLTVPEQARRVE